MKLLNKRYFVKNPKNIIALSHLLANSIVQSDVLKKSRPLGKKLLIFIFLQFLPSHIFYKVNNQLVIKQSMKNSD